MKTIKASGVTFEEKAQELATFGRTVCGSTLLFENGEMKRVRDCTFIEKLSAVAIYKYGTARVYKI
jgi:hypothetical protein